MKEFRILAAFVTAFVLLTLDQYVPSQFWLAHGIVYLLALAQMAVVWDGVKK